MSATKRRPLWRKTVIPRLLSRGRSSSRYQTQVIELNHEGNGIHCRYDNHDGCTRGVECKFSHAPDHKSVRDRLYAFPSDLLLACRNADFGR
ncbi:hypothetical protein EDB87DRAFT_754517 [Lactarius vividus]|nr:hypothetical protein EDB87DRAFT_754517 [Lactarius vividus]